MRSGAASPLVSVVVPTRDRNALLAETLASVAAQNWPRIEVVIVNDRGAEDPRAVTARIVRPGLVSTVIDLTDVPADRDGAQVARNVGFQHASGAFVLFLDSDDLLGEGCLARRMAALDADPALDFVVGNCLCFDGVPRPDDPPWSVWRQEQDDLFLFVSGRVPWQTSGPLWRRAALDRLGPWAETLRAGHDYEFHIRALAHGLRHRRLDGADFFWRKPRSDSYSGHEAFKRQHREGQHIAAFERSVDAVDAQNRWTGALRDAAWREGVRLAFLARLFGAGRAVAQSVLQRLLALHCGGAFGYVEATACNRLWLEAFGRNPVQSYLKARGYLGPGGVPA
ncbi:glycosyltransferase family 2 protein [Prosthecomicrobium pneumaticum]|uniref:Glycosyltransferase involved in cell wall biosynthesis n=1 Tax=Prosthecomicrobium pneumaticum TaxID=81895 RepID=A0A7W9CU10_9HYPH|nr:glycosyltransferase [Prosthecomicrobium pneumaticum]MBB5751882.1 glycosyltransferase involved in cell wall biosynthesis [Prosthecomicrobium pneumaticum]